MSMMRNWFIPFPRPSLRLRELLPAAPRRSALRPLDLDRALGLGHSPVRSQPQRVRVPARPGQFRRAGRAKVGPTGAQARANLGRNGARLPCPCDPRPPLRPTPRRLPGPPSATTRAGKEGSTRSSVRVIVFPRNRFLFRPPDSSTRITLQLCRPSTSPQPPLPVAAFAIYEVASHHCVTRARGPCARCRCRLAIPAN